MGVARQHIKSLPDFRPDIVIVSPTMRAMETASGIFGGDHDVENGGVLMTSQQAEEVANPVNSMAFGCRHVVRLKNGTCCYQEHPVHSVICTTFVPI